jgi:Leucine-rich repeat (LRR) protein
VTQEDFKIPINPHYSYTGSGALVKGGRIHQLRLIEEKYIPSTVFGLTRLKVLEIRQTCFFPCDETTIPLEIQCLASSLTSLGIYDTTITHLPDTIGELKHLTALKISNTDLTSLPDTIGYLLSLTLLDLSNNKLTSLPITIRNLKNLQRLTLKNNPDLHSIEPINNLHSLSFLDTRNCPIEILPQNLPNIRTLYMTNNSLTNLSGIETLGYGTDSAKSFYFGDNHIRVISPSIDQVKNLYSLHLDNNEIRTLPSNIYNISTLRYLYVHNNFINWIELQDISRRFKRD